MTQSAPSFGQQQPPTQQQQQQQHQIPSTFPVSGSVAPAAFTPASAHAASASHASTSAVNALSAPASARASPAHPAAATETATPAQPPLAAVAAGPSTTNPKVLPYLFDDAQLDDVLVLVVDMLVKLTEHNDSLPLHPSALTRFHSRATPNISLSAYLRRIAKYTSIEKCCVLILLVYIDRVCERLEGFTICGLTVHRFICAAILCASKALCDAFNTNEHYAKVGGISLQEINLLEKEFLQIIDWRLICSGAVLQHYYASLVRSHKDYVLAEPKLSETVEKPRLSSEMNLDQAARNGHGSNGSSGASASSPSSSSGASRDRNSAARLGVASANATPFMAASSQHSSPFPVSSNSNSASPFIPAAPTTTNGSSIVGLTSSTPASVSASSTSPVSAMQVDPTEAPAQTTNRRRKDEHRSPPSPRSATMPSSSTSANANAKHLAHSSDGGIIGNGINAVPQPSSIGNAEAYKRTRFDHPPPPPPPPSQPPQ